ncbi:MAG: class I tRNA ligase family protein, partial [Chlorobium phaeobacteroides]|nr:class I tRNA ligase family protein [Chlorobium phaeobacteroides]
MQTLSEGDVCIYVWHHKRVMSSNLEKTYNHHDVEGRWNSAHWESLGTFDAESSRVIEGDKASYTVLMPPPNVTGSLTLGHVLNHTLQDIFIRYQRMSGREALWLPGTDHAGIATQTVVEKKLRKDGVSRYDLGRKEFLEHVWKWRGGYGGGFFTNLQYSWNCCVAGRGIFFLHRRPAPAGGSARLFLLIRGCVDPGGKTA